MTEPFEKITLHTKHADLAGDYFDNNSDKGIILFPGFTEHRSSLHALASKLSEDFKVWTFDINSQGESTGNFNLPEIAQSLSEATCLLKNSHNLSKFGAHGNSLGGMAVGLISAEHDNLYSAICLTSTPAAIQDVVPNYASTLLKYVPQFAVRQATIHFDKRESASNENYRRKSHAQFYVDGSYKKYAQFGALKISSIHDVAKWAKNAPRLDAEVHKIVSPVLYVYGGNDGLLGFKNNAPPQIISHMYLKTGSPEKLLSIWHDADHSLNISTRTDETFNHDDKKYPVKEFIVNHFREYML